MAHQLSNKKFHKIQIKRNMGSRNTQRVCISYVRNFQLTQGMQSV